jgi:hypothetical protein
MSLLMYFGVVFENDDDDDDDDVFLSYKGTIL